MKRIPAAILTALSVLPFCAYGNYTLTLLHFNDAESHTLHAGNPENDPDAAPTTATADLVNYGGAARFVNLLDRMRGEAETDAVLTISAGDNFIPCIVLDASNPDLNKHNPGGDNFDARYFGEAKVDFSVAGNHDFDMGPDYLAQFVRSVHEDGAAMNFVSCNLDASGAPELAAELAPCAVFERAGEKIGVIGATTWELADISSPGSVRLIDADKDGDADIDDAAQLVQAQIDRLTSDGVDKIVLVAHLQSIRNDQALVRKLRGVDVEISGGGHEVLAGEDFVAIPDSGEPFGAYPLLDDANGEPVLDLDGRNVPVITAGSALRYVGRLVVEFDDDGNVLSARGGPILVTALSPEQLAGAVKSVPDEAVETETTEPIYDFVEDYGNAEVAVSEVPLDGIRTHVRNRETNLGDLVSDAILEAGREQAAVLGLRTPEVAVINGGSIRCDAMIDAGTITNIAIKNILPFVNYIALVEDVSPDEFKTLAERMVAEAGESGGCFGQISGFSIRYDGKAPAGSRVRDVVLDDGRVIVQTGDVVNSAPTVCFATVNFLARGGDSYPFPKDKAVNTPLLQGDAIRDFAAKTLDGKISADRYPEEGLKRVVDVSSAASESVADAAL